MYILPSMVFRFVTEKLEGEILIFGDNYNWVQNASCTV